MQCLLIYVTKRCFVQEHTGGDKKRRSSLLGPRPEPILYGLRGKQGVTWKTKKKKWKNFNFHRHNLSCFSRLLSIPLSSLIHQGRRRTETWLKLIRRRRSAKRKDCKVVSRVNNILTYFLLLMDLDTKFNTKHVLLDK